MVEYYWLEGQYNRLPSLMADLVSRRVAVIAALVSAGALAVKAATTTIPIVFVVSENPVSLGLVASLARPGGNMTGINIFFHELVAKRLGLRFSRGRSPGTCRCCSRANSSSSQLGAHALPHRLPPEHVAAAIPAGRAEMREPEEVERLWSINLQTARALGLEVPNSMQLLADEVIE